MVNGKLLLIDIDNNIEEFSLFKFKIEKILNVEGVIVPVNIDQGDDYYKKLSQASINLEEFILLHDDYRIYNEDKPFINVIYAMHPYSCTNIENLNPYMNIFVKDLVIFQENDLDKEISWIFGNIISMIKLSSSLFRLVDVDISNDRFGKHTTFKHKMLWYGSRILLDIRGIA